MKRLIYFISIIFLLLLKPIYAESINDYSYTGNYSYNTYFIKLLIAIVITVILASIVIKILKKYDFLSFVDKTKSESYINIISSKIIAPGKSLLIVEVDGEKFLIGITKDNMNLINKLRKNKREKG